MRRDLRDKIENPKETEDLMAQLHEAPYGTIPDHEWALIFDRAFEKIQALRSGVKMIDGAYDEVLDMTAKLQEENGRLRAELKSERVRVDFLTDEIDRLEKELEQMKNRCKEADRRAKPYGMDEWKGGEEARASYVERITALEKELEHWKLAAEEAAEEIKKLRAENKILHEEIRLREVAGWRELK